MPRVICRGSTWTFKLLRPLVRTGSVARSPSSSREIPLQDPLPRNANITSEKYRLGSWLRLTDGGISHVIPPYIGALMNTSNLDRAYDAMSKTWAHFPDKVIDH